MHVAESRTPISEHVVTPETTNPRSHRGEHVVPASMVREHLVSPVPTSPLSGGFVASHKSTGVGMTHSVIVSSPKSEHIVIPIASYPCSHSGWHTSPGKSVFAQLPAIKVSGNVTVHFVLSIGRHVARVNCPSAEHEDFITPDNSKPSSHSGVHVFPDASCLTLPLVTTLLQLSSSFCFPSLPLSGGSYAHAAAGTGTGSSVGGAGPGSSVGGAGPGSSVGGAGPGSSVGGAEPGSSVGGAEPGSSVGGAEPGLSVGAGAVQTTFVSVPSMQLACAVDFSYPSLHSGVHASPYSILPLPGTNGGVQVPSEPLAGVTYTSSHLWLACATLAPHRRRATAKCLAHGEPPRNMRVDFWPPPFPRSRRRARARARPPFPGSCVRAPLARSPSQVSLTHREDPSTRRKIGSVPRVSNRSRRRRDRPSSQSRRSLARANTCRDVTSGSGARGNDAWVSGVCIQESLQRECLHKDLWPIDLFVFCSRFTPTLAPLHVRSRPAPKTWPAKKRVPWCATIGGGSAVRARRPSRVSGRRGRIVGRVA